MPTWTVRGPTRGGARSWCEQYPELAQQVTRITAPRGRGIAWEGTEIRAWRERPAHIGELLAANVARDPQRTAYVFHPGGERLSWAEVGERVRRAAARLQRTHGFGKRDRLCLLTLGCPEYVVGYLAAVALGGIAVPVNLGLPPEGLVAQIAKVGAKVLVVAPEVWAGRLDALRAQLPSVEQVFVTGDGEAPPGTRRFAELLQPAAEPAVPPAIDEWDLCAISFTSGTTGVPKGTMAMHLNALGCARNIATAAKGLTADDVNLCMPPLYHNTAVYTDFMPALLTGGTCVVMRQFEPLAAIELIERERVTWAVAAPIMLWLMMNHPAFAQHDCRTLKKILFGGHAASETFIRQLQQCFEPVAMVNGGSVSESTALGFALPTEEAIRKITSAIFDDDGHQVTEPGVIGEVGYRGQQTNAGYWDEPGKTAEVFRADGFVLSGDWAKIDADGYLWLLDRKKDMVVRGGQNVYCIEVENKLFLHPAVLRAAVVGVPDHVFSERLKAVLVLKPGHALTPQQVREHCAAHLAPYEVPEYVVFASALPTNAAGKTLKTALRDFWGDGPAGAPALLDAFAACQPPALRARPALRLDGRLLGVDEARQELRAGSALGRRLAAAIDAGGLLALLKPDEARFRA